MLFDTYLFADYSGAVSSRSQRRSIRLALATQSQDPRIFDKRFTRETLTSEIVSLLKDATRAGQRCCFGQDHQYSIPLSFATELSIQNIPWRESITSLVDGTYGPGAPPLSHPRTFGAALNGWLTSRGKKPYFYSATKAALYKVPPANPRPKDLSAYRLTERCKTNASAGNPKSLNRIGDPGSVGGQTLLGLVALHKLFSACERETISVAVWPFDGLDITGDRYRDCHVMVEPYPTALREKSIAQSDDTDALSSAAFLRTLDAQGSLLEALNLEDLTSEEKFAVQFEGWILGHRPHLRRF